MQGTAHAFLTTRPASVVLAVGGTQWIFLLVAFKFFKLFVCIYSCESTVTLMEKFPIEFLFLTHSAKLLAATYQLT